MWEDRYSQEEYAYGKKANDFLVENYQQIPQGRVLCLAEGEGRNAVFLAQQGYEVVAVDSAAAGMAKAQKLAAEKGVEITTIVKDLADFEIEENSYDGVVSIFAHLPPALRKQVHAEVVKGLRSGGVLLLEAYTPEQLAYKTGGPPVAEMTMQLDQLWEEFAGLDFKYGIESVRDVREGLYHTGKGAVVQLIAIKP